MPQTLPISQIKARLPELVAGVEEEIVVTRKGKPAAVLINVAEYERLKETLDRSKKFYAEGERGFSFEDVFDEPLASHKKRQH